MKFHIIPRSTIYLYTEFQCLHIFLCLKFYFSSPLVPVIPVFFLQSFCFHPLIISCIQVFRGLPLPLLPGGHHSQTLLGILSSGILASGSTNNNKYYVEMYTF